MSQWNVTIATVRDTGTELVRGRQIWVVDVARPHEARELALTAAVTPDAARHRRGALLDTTSIDVDEWQNGW
ncbi:hypothetical protein [Streptacidiphilus cavernicola]|uniref:Uncharacterized protein n=1 Tax=Streptacidiphilus cavernicola TaxID=3342716 RepID=A0ABV6W5N6_9ACTN